MAQLVHHHRWSVPRDMERAFAKIQRQARYAALLSVIRLQLQQPAKQTNLSNLPLAIIQEIEELANLPSECAAKQA
ncbi:hypothetical protein WJX74_001414 [Apatococcus lobatus]|uniref:Uncharacterized protein n=1 Tax=Apatococcus lobatus TaxID=904363 RepID=A0AAW1R2I5_9CHLO